MYLIHNRSIVYKMCSITVGCTISSAEPLVKVPHIAPCFCNHLIIRFEIIQSLFSLSLTAYQSVQITTSEHSKVQRY